MTDARLKIWIGLGKWFVVSVGLVVMTKIIDTGFKDREVGLNEIKEYDKYVEIATDTINTHRRRLLAHYYANITPSKKLRKGWMRYYESINEEYLNDKRDKELATQRVIDIIETDSIKNKGEIIYLKSKIERLNNDLSPTKEIKDKYESAKAYEELGFNYLLEKDISNSILAFEKSESYYNTFHQVYEIARYLKRENLNVSSNNEIDWVKIYKTILNNYSWKMPEDAKSRLEQRII